MFRPGSRREVQIVRRQTARQYLVALEAEPITCQKAIEIYSRLETAERDELERLGAHLVTQGHESLCPYLDQRLRQHLANILRRDSP